MYSSGTCIEIHTAGSDANNDQMLQNQRKKLLIVVDYVCSYYRYKANVFPVVHGTTVINLNNPVAPRIMTLFVRVKTNTTDVARGAIADAGDLAVLVVIQSKVVNIVYTSIHIWYFSQHSNVFDDITCSRDPM